MPPNQFPTTTTATMASGHQEAGAGPSSFSRSRILGGIDPSLSFSSSVARNNDKNTQMDGCIRQKSCSLVQKIRECLPDLTPAQWHLLVVFAVADFLAGIVYNIKGPFFPQEAEKKHVTSGQFGFVFGIFDLTKVLVCPIFGKHMSSLGPKKVFISSMVLISLCSIAFGLLDKIDRPSTFLTLSLLIRIFEAVGSAGFSTSMFSIIASAFPSTVATTFASLETFFGMGLIAGPLFGGALINFGYDVPFIVTGLLLFFAAIVILSTMPGHTSSTPMSTTTPTESGDSGNFTPTIHHDSPKPELGLNLSLWSVLKIRGVMLALFGVFAAASSAGFVNATLEPHIRQFNLSPVQVGIVFVIYGTIYALTAPGWGWLCDRLTSPKIITLIGGLLNLFAFLLIGPVPFLWFESILWVTCFGLVLHGLALGALFVSGFVLSLRYTIASGFPNDTTTYGVVSGVFCSALSFGMCCGPIIGGFLLERVGFRWGSLYVIASSLILIVLIVMYLLKNGIGIQCSESPGLSEVPEQIREPLLKSRTIRVYSGSDEFSGGGSSSGHAQIISYGSA